MLQEMIQIVRQAGQTVRCAQLCAEDIHEKSSVSDLVTKYDVEVQSFLRQNLLKLQPIASFLGEEGKQETVTSDWVFIVDPIDGTANFTRGLNYSNVSVALAYRGVVQYGVVYNPFADELYAAERYHGAFLNGKEIHVSDRDISHAIILCGSTIYDRQLTDQTFSIMRSLYDIGADFRRFGAAALDLCQVAAGRAEILFECRLRPWDFAAGSLILEEAGGCCRNLRGESLSPLASSSIFATNKDCACILSQLNITAKEQL